MKSPKFVVTLALLLCSVLGSAQIVTQYTAYTSIGIQSTVNSCVAGTNCWVKKTGISGVTFSNIYASSDGTLWAVSTAHNAYKYTPRTSTWVNMSANKAGYFSSIAPVNATTLYASSTLGHNWQYNFSTSAWVELANDGVLTSSITAGSDGDLWAVSTTASGCGYKLYHRNLSSGTWVSTSYTGSQIAVANASQMWIRCSNNSVTSVDLTSGAITASPVAASQVAVAGDGSVWMIGTNGSPYTLPGGPYDNSAVSPSCCQQMGGTGTKIATGSTISTYMLDSTGNLYYFPAFVRSLSVVVEGQTICTASVQSACPMQGLNHTGTTKAQAPGNSVAVVNSESVPWPNYLQVSSTDTSTTLFEGDCPDPTDTTGGCSAPSSFIYYDVKCAVLGTILSNGMGGVDDGTYLETEGATTRLIGTGPLRCTTLFGVQVCTQPVKSWCSNTTTPDLNPSTLITAPPQWTETWDDTAVCFRYHISGGTTSKWVCSPGLALKNANVLQRPFCTYNP